MGATDPGKQSTKQKSKQPYCSDCKGLTAIHKEHMSAAQDLNFCKEDY